MKSDCYSSTQSQNIKDINYLTEQYYLSSNLSEKHSEHKIQGFQNELQQNKQLVVNSFQNTQDQQQLEISQEERNTFKYFNYAINLIISFAQLVFTILSLPLLCFIILITFIVKCQNFKDILNLLWIFISTISINHTVINFFFFRDFEIFAVEQILQDTVFFVFTCFLVILFLKVNIEQNHSPITMICNPGQYLPKCQATLVQIIEQEKQISGYFLDYQELNQFTQAHCLPTPSQYYRLFDCSELLPIDKLLNVFDQQIQIELQKFFLLSCVVILKLFLIFYYLYIHQLMKIQPKDVIDLIISIFTYLYITFLLCRTLGNFDLIRKIKSFNQLQEYINFSDKNFFFGMLQKQKLDILCPSSLEAWDNCRKLILQHEKNLLIDLEVAYICLTFYYLFVAVISASGLYEFYWIIPKQSILLSDSVVIMSTFNFVFLSIFFLYRFYKGTQFNEGFDNLQLSTEELLDIILDLKTQYDDYFLIKRDSFMKVNSDCVYAIIIKKIKKSSKDIIKYHRLYLGQIYSKEQKQLLRKIIIKNTQQCLMKIIQSIQIDKQKHSYKFLNIVDIRFKEFLLTVLFLALTTLPQIIPKFINFYKK
ncbi:hypothetical protein ABPG74_011989 [Tetrahymena malaccensis]